MNILIVDDHPTNRKLLRALLEAEGITVCEAVDGRAALAVLDAPPLNAPVDAIISDILMPNMDGYRFCWEVRHNPRFQHLPFAFYSSTFTAPGDEEVAREFGGDAFIAKPSGVETILAVLRDIRARPRHGAGAELLPELDVMKHYSQRLIVKLEEQNAKLRERAAALEREAAERQSTQELLRQSEERFRALFDGGPIGMYSCDSAGVIQNYNRRAVELWGREPIHGETADHFRAAFRFYRPNGVLLPDSPNPMNLILAGEILTVQDQKVDVERPDGSRVVVVVNSVALRNEQGEITGALSCFYDVTERSRLEQQTLQQAQALAELARRKDEFLAMLSHELRNPLAAVSNAVSLLRLQRDESPGQNQARNIIERQVGQLKHLVDDLLEVSRISTGRVQLRRTSLDLCAVVARAVESTGPMIAQHMHDLTVSMPPEPVWLLADAARLEQVLVNLLNNAAKYTADGGRICLSVDRQIDPQPPTAVISVSDSGIGIAPEMLPQVFDLFTQADQSLHRSHGGLGIGLALVRRLVELHGGTVAASSVPGQGSEFVVRLPLLVRPAAELLVEAVTTVPAALDLPAPSAGSGRRVLLVDDNVDAAQTLGVLLEMNGHSVQLAYDGPAAIEAAIQYRPEVVLLDIGLPGLDGYQTAQRIRQQAGLAGIVLIALTGYGLESDRLRSQQAGFDRHLVKPASLDEIEQALRHGAQDKPSC